MWERETLHIIGEKPYRARIYKLTHWKGGVVYQVSFYRDQLPKKVVYFEGEALKYAQDGLRFLRRQTSIDFES